MKKALLALFMVASPFAQMFYVDTFNIPSPKTHTGNYFPEYDSVSGDPGQILGGIRYFRSGDGGSIEASNGMLTMEPFGAFLRYGSFGNPDNHLHLNMMAGRFEIDVTMIEGYLPGNPLNVHFPLSIGLRRFSDTDPLRLESAGSISHRIITAPGTYLYDLSLFGPTLSRADISDIAFGFAPLGSNKVQIDEIRLVLIPEPSTCAAVFAFGLLGFGVYKRTRR